jgi:hypothetical protein
MCCPCSCGISNCFDFYHPQFFDLQRKYFLQDWLLKEAQISQPDFMRRLQEVAPTVPGKAWRFVDEMREDGRMFAAAGLHPGCQEAAADTFDRLAHYKDAASGAVSLSVMAQSLQQNPKRA